MEKRPFSLPALLVNLAIPLLFGYAGNALNNHDVDTWYPQLNKPSFNPPDAVFGPVWTTIYVLLGIAAYLVWQRRDQIKHLPRTIAVYFIQLVLNLFWTFLFFYSHLIGACLFEILALLIAVVINAWMFYKVHKIAGLLLVPYILWVSFASVLTYNIYLLN